LLAFQTVRLFPRGFFCSATSARDEFTRLGDKARADVGFDEMAAIRVIAEFEESRGDSKPMLKIWGQEGAQMTVMGSNHRTQRDCLSQVGPIFGGETMAKDRVLAWHRRTENVEPRLACAVFKANLLSVIVSRKRINRKRKRKPKNQFQDSFPSS
jgi:hypothetical protein